MLFFLVGIEDAALIDLHGQPDDALDVGFVGQNLFLGAGRVLGIVAVYLVKDVLLDLLRDVGLNTKKIKRNKIL